MIHTDCVFKIGFYNKKAKKPLEKVEQLGRYPTSYSSFEEAKAELNSQLNAGELSPNYRYFILEEIWSIAVGEEIGID